MIRPLYVGNALQVFLEPPAGSKVWRVLRKGADSFTGPDDAGAFLAYEGSDKVIVDAQFLQNGVPAFYRAFYWDGAQWTASATASGTPNATYSDRSTDALSVLRDRLEAGLAVEVQRAVLSPAAGFIQVLTAPPIADNQTRFPLVTVHLTSEEPRERGIGEGFEVDEFDSITGKWNEAEGWLANVRVEVVGWSLNPDERIELRKAIRRVLVANLAVFDAAGMVEIDFSFQDMDAISGEYNAPLFQTLCNFACAAPIRVVNPVDPIVDVQVNAIPFQG